MKPYDTPLNDDLCSKVWLKPIAHKQNTYGIEKLGLEMEFHAYDAQSLAPLGTEQSSLTPQDVLYKVAELSKNFSLVKDVDTNEIIGVKLPNGGNFSLEPGGQIEYASVPCTNLNDLSVNIQYGLELLERATEKNVLYLSHGTNPIASSTHPLVVPKKRYKFMTRYFQSAPKNIRGLDMMRHSATVQPNLDIFENVEWHTGVNLVLNLVPITSALFANSRYFQGHKSKFFSERQNIWENMDPSRSGFPVNLLSSNGCPQTECTYAKWAKNAYMLFVDSLPYEEQPLYGEITFEKWLMDGYKGLHPTVGDWETHLSTLFPHLRLRHFLEVRNIDAQPFSHSLAPISLFSALLKTKETQQKSWELLLKYNLDSETIFQPNQNFSDVFEPLLDLASEILNFKKEQIGVNSLQKYKNFLNTREEYWKSNSALEFVKTNATYSPAQEFVIFS